MDYYYFVASLPLLRMDEKPAVSSEFFLAACEDQLSPAHFEDVRCVWEGRSGRHFFARRWMALDTQLRNALARGRAAAREVPAEHYLRPHEGFDPGVERVAAEALAMEDPLHREQHLDHFRWRLAEDLAREEPFGAATVLAYAVKLQMSERWSRLTDEKGRQALEETLAGILEASPLRKAS